MHHSEDVSEVSRVIKKTCFLGFHSGMTQNGLTMQLICACVFNMQKVVFLMTQLI